MAAASPCTQRAAISVTASGATAQPTDAAVKIAKPAMKTRLAPIRSPSAPAVRMKAAKAMV
ncbi:hypothetical protein BRSPCE3_39260 [Bradyrhizobium sp. Ce-3]|nr:hypothetical protein BRSPCE3_39260 [Bradyrhizobium sp. Ce-3]